MVYSPAVEIESIRHKGLRRFAETGDERGVIEPKRVRNMLLLLVDSADFEALMTLPNFGLHPLTGDRADTWAMTITRNWRMTFVKLDEQRIAVLDMEDYH